MHNVRVTVNHKSIISHDYNEVNWTKNGEFCFTDKDLFSCHIKQIMNVLSFMLWNKYFHSVKDEMFHSSSCFTS